jgi:hypothetical protein
METLGVHRKLKYRRSTFCLLLLAPLFGIAGEAAAEKYFFRFSGKPGPINCTDTSNTINPGLKVSWNLPPDTPVQAVVRVGETAVIDELQFPSSLSGTLEMKADTTSWTTATPMPCTIVHSMTPLVSGAKPSSLRYDCVNGKGTQFRISNAPPN